MRIACALGLWFVCVACESALGRPGASPSTPEEVAHNEELDRETAERKADFRRRLAEAETERQLQAVENARIESERAERREAARQRRAELKGQCDAERGRAKADAGRSEPHGYSGPRAMLVDSGACVTLQMVRQNATAEERADVQAEIEAELRAFETERQATCAAGREARAARLAELEPKVTALRAARQEAARTRPEDEAWVRANCRWENDPRYALEVERRRRAGETQYVVNERFAGFGRSVPKCPKSTSARRLQIAAEIANGLVNPQNAGIVTKVMRDLEDEKAGVAEYERLKALAVECGDGSNSPLPLGRQPSSANSIGF